MPRIEEKLDLYRFAQRFKTQLSRANTAALVVSATVGAACTLPAEQLTFPTSIKSPSGNTASPVAARKSGVPTSDAGSGVVDAQSFEGTGRFTDFPSPRPSIAPSGSGGISLSLVGATVPEAAQAIIADALGASYVVSEKVKAKITLQTSRPIPRESVLEIFEDVLRAEGAALVVERGVYKILPQEEAIAAGAPLTSGSRRPTAGLSTQILPLRYVSATEIERIIKSIAPRANVIRVDTARNLLVVVGSKAELATMIDTVNIFDVDYMRSMSFAIHPVDSSDPEAIVQELEAVFSNDREGPAKGVVRFIPNRRLKAVLVISPNPEYLSKAKIWIERLDMVGKNTEKQVYVYHVQSRPAADMASLLQRVYNPAIGAGGSALLQPTSPVATGSLVSSSSQDAVGRSIAVTSVTAPQITAVPQPGAGASSSNSSALRGPGVAGALLNQPDPITSTDGLLPTPSGPAIARDDKNLGLSVVPDEANNSLIITATPSQYKRVVQVLQRIDLTPNQVLLEATIAEVTLNDQVKFGLRWYFQNGGHSVKMSDVASGAVSSVFPGFSYFLNAANFQVALNALSSVTDVNIVSSPTLMVLDNKKAQLQVGDEVPVATQSAVSVLTPGAPIVNSVSFRNTGVILNITPRISDHGRILLDVEQEVSDVVPTTSSSIDSPTIQQRRVRTTVSVNDGESIILAGMIQDRASRARDQVPLVGELPVFGNLFKNKTDIIKRTELLIAITPTVVKDPQQSQAVTAEFRDRLNLSLRPQRAGPPDRREQVDRLVR